MKANTATGKAQISHLGEMGRGGGGKAGGARDGKSIMQ
jgi:hypothetical protein